MTAIGGFRSDLSIARKTDGNFGNVSAGVLFSKVAYQRKRWQGAETAQNELEVISKVLLLFCLDENIT